MTNLALNSDMVYGLYGGGFFGQFTRIALILDVFTPLVDEPAPAEKVAKICNTSVEGMRAILDYLYSTKVIDFDLGTKNYALTTSARAFLVPKEKTYAGNWVLANTDPIMWEKMLETIQTGQSAGYKLPWAQDAWLESYSPSRIESSLALWKTVGIKPEKDVPFYILDLASGCGIKTMALAHENQSVQVTCLDSEAVLDVARDLAKRLEIESQISFFDGDLLGDDFGSNEYNVAMLGLITYILTPEQNINVFDRAYRSLKSGGKLVIDAIMTTEEPREWASRATLLMKTWNGGAAHSFSEYSAWLKKVGFREVIQHNEQLLSAIK
jgi:ubiquinone/menaquinone biosynthesis C-methylase UbiE/predicted transcriptional regulator